MALLDYFRRKREPEAQARPQHGEAGVFAALTSADLYDFMRGGTTASGKVVTGSNALQNMALLRCVSVISQAMGMLPLNVISRDDEKEHATEHPLYAILKHRPNDYQGAYKFRSHMQAQVLLHGNSYARVIRRGDRVVRLIPLASQSVTPKLDLAFQVSYEVRSEGGSSVTLPARDVLHLSDLPDDAHGLLGISRVKKAQEAIGLALQAERAAARLFTNGVMAGGALQFDKKLNTQQIQQISDSLAQRYAGADNAHKWMVLEDGGKALQFSNTAADAQHIENRNHQIEEIARCFGVPRPLLMMDDTSWGSGIEQLGKFFVEHGLRHWFKVWEEAIELTLMSDQDRDAYQVKFNDGALLRGTLKDQAEFFAKASGSGGHMPWMTANEIRELMDMPKLQGEEADRLNDMRKPPNEPAQTA
jgi:HK97 family phage portal protein